MTREEQVTIIENRLGGLLSLLKSKGADYAAENDVLKNFKGTAKMCEILKIPSNTPEGQCMHHIVLKLDRLCNLVFSGKEPNNESIGDTVADFIGYLLLFECILEERKQ